MDIVILTRFFPFSNRIDFIEDQIPFFSKEFNRVFILSESRESCINYELPVNCFAKRIRKKRFYFVELVISAFSLLSLKVIRELFFSKKSLGFRCFWSKLKQIFIYLYYSRIYSKAIKRIDIDPSKTFFLAHWCDQKAYSLALLKKKKRIKYCASIAHGFDCFIERGYLPFRREIFTYLDYVFPVSEAGCISISKNIMPYIPLSKCQIVPCHLGITKKNDALNPSQKNEKCIVVTCSNIVNIKRLDLLINALELENNISIEWNHFGTGEMENEIKRMANEKLSNKKNISFNFYGQKDNIFIQDFYSTKHIDVFVNCSDAEGLPFSLMEACSYGIPVVARDVGGNSEIVIDSVNGILLDKTIKPIELLNAIKLVCDNSHFREGAYKVFANKFNASDNSNVLINFIKNIMV